MPMSSGTGVGLIVQPRSSVGRSMSATRAEAASAYGLVMFTNTVLAVLSFAIGSDDMPGGLVRQLACSPRLESSMPS
jgi:hypothetical protein